MESEVNETNTGSRNVKEGSLRYRFGTFRSHEDPMPEYISPELVTLIAQNAPSELDVFNRSLQRWSKLPASTRSGSLEQNHIPKPLTMHTRHSCPEVKMSSDSGTEDSQAHREKNVKRKRPKSLDPSIQGSRSTGSPILVSSLKDERKDVHVGSTTDEVLFSPKVVDLTAFGVDRRSDECRPASAPTVSASRYESDVLDAKPWRHGMKKKRISTELQPLEAVPCKRNIELDPKKHSEVKNFMETKFALLRKERHLQKARAEAAITARKEKQRKLDVECQALLKSQAADVKTTQKVCFRPPWTSEYVTLAETFRPWSRASTGDLPPPKVPRNQEPVPLDLYTSISRYEAAQQSLLHEGCNAPSYSKLETKGRSKKLKTRKGAKQLQSKNVTSDMYEMAFPPTHPYHALHPQPKIGTRKTISFATKAKWKSKGSLKRFNPQRIYQLKSPLKYASQKAVDLMVYRRTTRTSRIAQSGSLCRETRGARMQKRSKSCSRHGYTNILQQDDCYAISALKDHERDVRSGSKVKRLKPTSASITEHISLPQFELKPKYSRVKPVKPEHVAANSEELLAKDTVKVMTSRLSPDSSRDTAHTANDSVSRYTIDLRKRSRNASLSPHRHLRDEDILQVLESTRAELLNPCKSLRKEVTPQPLGSTRQESMNPGKHLRDEGTMQVLHQRNDMSNIDIESNKDVTQVIRRQRMHMLRSLAEQLAKRVDEACAEQQLQNTPKMISEPMFESSVDLNSEPVNRPVGLYFTDEPLQVEPKFYYHSAQPDVLYHGHLSELEQAGCDTVEFPKKERMPEMIPSVSDLSKDPFKINTEEVTNFLGIEISPNDWNVTDKRMCISDNIPSQCSSSGPSSPSTGTSSPVILPMGAKYKVRSNKSVEEPAHKRQKEDWTLPAEEDIHSVINLYTQHCLREKKKNRARCELTDTGQGECEENMSLRSRTRFHEHAPEKHKFKFGAAPVCTEMKMSKTSDVRFFESDSLTSTKCDDSSWVHTQLLENDYNESTASFMEQSTDDNINITETPSHLEKSTVTVSAEPMKDDISQKKQWPGDSSQSKPEGMSVQIGDLRLCQSPTSFHLRLDTHKDDHHLKKPSRDLGAISYSKMKTTTTHAYTPPVGSTEVCQTFGAPIAPMKITYARRLQTRTKPDGACTDDERIILEFHQISREGATEVKQSCSKEGELSVSSTSEASTENLRVNMVGVQNFDDPDCNLHVKGDSHELKDGSAVLVRSDVLQPETQTSNGIPVVVSKLNGASGKEKFKKVVSKRTSSRSKNKETYRLSSLSSSIEQSEENLDPLHTVATDSVGEEGYSNLLQKTTIHCEGQSDGPASKQPDFPGKSICLKLNTKISSDEPVNCREDGKDQESKERKENNGINSTTPTFGPMNRPHQMESLQDSAEQRWALLFESKREVHSQQNSESTRELQLKSRRCELEAELQKLDAEIRKTRAKLQMNHSVFDKRTRECEQSAASVVATEKISPTFSEFKESIKIGGVLSDDLNDRFSNRLPSSRALSDSPRQRTPAFPSKAAGSAPLRTLDRKVASPIYSNSFMSEDIQTEEEISSATRFEMVPGTVGERHGNHYELQSRENKFMNKNSRHSDAKSKSICLHEQSAEEVLEEELLNCRSMSVQDDDVDEGSENSTGRVPSKSFERASKRAGRLATILSSSTKLDRSSSRVSDDQIVNQVSQLQRPVMQESKQGILPTAAVQTNPISEDYENFTHNVKEMKGGTLSSAPFDRDVKTGSKDTDLTTHNRRESNHTTGGENESGSRRSISPQQANGPADRVHDAVNDSSAMNLREDRRDIQWYVPDVHDKLPFGNRPLRRRTMITPVSKIDMPSGKISTSSSAGEQSQVHSLEEDSSSSSKDVPKSRVLEPDTPEAEEVMEISSASSRDELEGKRKTSETAINTRVNFKRLPVETAKILEGVNVLPSRSSSEKLLTSKGRPYFSDVNPPFHCITQKSSEVSARDEEESYNLENGGKSTNVFGAGDTGNVFHDPPTAQSTRDGTALEPSEPVVPQQNPEDLTLSRDSLNEVVKGTSPSNLEGKNSMTMSFQHSGFSSSESGRMRRLWKQDSEVTQNSTNNSNEENIKQQLEQENISLTTSEDDKPKLFRNPLHPDSNPENLNVVVPRIRLHQHHEEKITFDVRDPMCLQEGPSCSVQTVERTITATVLESNSGYSNARNDGSRNPSKLPQSEPPLSESYTHSITQAPGRSQWSLRDPGSDVTTDQIRASTDLDQSTDSSTDVEKQAVSSVSKQRLRPPLTKKRRESSSVGIHDGLHCDFQTSKKRGMKHWEKLVRLCQENDRNRSQGVQIFSPQNAFSPTVQKQSPEVGEVPRTLLEATTRDESSSTGVPKVIYNFITPRDDTFCDSSHHKEISHRFRSSEPNPLKSESGKECNNDLITSIRAQGKIDMPIGNQRSTPVTNTDLSRSLPRQPLNQLSSLYNKGEWVTCFNSEGSEVSEALENFDLEPDEKLETDMDAKLTREFVKVEQFLEPCPPQHSDACWNIAEISGALDEESLRMAVSNLREVLNIENTVRVENEGEKGLTKSNCAAEVINKIINRCQDIQESEDCPADINCNPGGNVGQSQRDPNAMLTAISGTWMKNLDSNESKSSSDVENESEKYTSREIVRDSTDRIDLGHDIDFAADLCDPADREYSDQYSTRESSRTLINLTSYSLGVSSPVVKNVDRHEMVSGAIEEPAQLVATDDLQISRPYLTICGKTKTPSGTDFGFPNPLPFLPIARDKQQESLVREVSTSKLSDFSPRLEEEDCLYLAKNDVGNLDPQSKRCCSEDKEKSDTPENTSTESVDRRFHEKEAVKVPLVRLEAQRDEPISIPPTTGIKFTSRISEPPTSSLPDEAHRLVECFLSSGSELLDRASQVSKAFSRCSVVDYSPGTLPSLECSDPRMVRTSIQAQEEEDFSSMDGLHGELLSNSNATETADDGHRQQVFPCEPDGTKIPEFFNPSRPDQIISLSLNPNHRQRGNSTLDGKPAVLNTEIPRVPTEQDANSRFTTRSIHDQISARESSEPAISQQIPEVGESRVGSGNLHHTNSGHDAGGKSYPSGENCIVEVAFEHHPIRSVVYSEGSCVSRQEKAHLDATQEAEIQDNTEQSLCRQPNEDTSIATGHDQDSICSIAGSGESQDLDGTLEDTKLQTPTNSTRKHNLMVDTLTDMLFETLLAEGLSDIACTSRSISRASALQASQTPTISKTLNAKLKCRSSKGFIGVLQHFLPIGWRAASLKHKSGLFLQVEGLRSHPLCITPGKSLSVSEIERLPGTLHNSYPSLDEFERCSLIHRTATEIEIPLLTSKEYVQSYVQKGLELSSLLIDPSPSNWYNPRIPIAQDIYKKVMEIQQSSSRFGALKMDDWQVQSNLLSDMVNESLIKYSAMMHHSPSTLSVSADDVNIVHFVTSSIVEHSISASKQSPDIDKVIGRLLDDEQWEKCYEEARDIISDLAQAILCDLIDRFVQEMMVQGRTPGFGASVYINSNSAH